MKGSKEERKKASTKEGRKKDSTVTNPQVWSLVEGPKSTYMPRRSPSHMPRSLLPRNGLEASLSSKVITSAPEERGGGGGLARWEIRVCMQQVFPVFSHCKKQNPAFFHWTHCFCGYWLHTHTQNITLEYKWGHKFRLKHLLFTSISMHPQ